MRRPVRILATAIALAASGCAGGGGGNDAIGPVSPPAAPPVPPPSPPPSPPPPPASFFENNEYERDYSKALIHASAAYAAGATGQGVTIAVIDTGVDSTSGEFAGVGKLTSIDIYNGTSGFTPTGSSVVRNSPDDQQGHGTGVASVAAADKLPQNSPLLATFPSGMHGVAFNASILSIRADDSDPSCSPNCEFDTRAIAAGVEYAIRAGAKVINLSLGGDATVDPTLAAALTDAVKAGVVVVAAAGNADTGKAPSPSPDFPGNFAATAAAQGRAIVVGSVGYSGAIGTADLTKVTISSFSNGAQGAEREYVVAPGEGLTVAYPVGLAVASDPNSPCKGGNVCYSTNAAGTSFATPQVAGAIALLLQAFPALSPENAVSILLNSADDLGAAGPDSVYGMGLIDLAKAFAPMGATSVTFGQGSLSAAAPMALVNAAPAGATGDWITASGLLKGVIMRDAYDRAYTIDPQAPPPASTLQSAFETAALGQRLAARQAGFAIGDRSFAFAAFRAPDDAYIAHPNLVTDADLTPELSLAVHDGPLSFAAGRGFSAPAPVGSLGVTTLTPTAVSGAIAALTSAGGWASVGYDLGRWSLGFRASGDNLHGFSATSLTRHFGAFGAQQAGIEFGSAYEQDSALGGEAASRLGGTDAAATTFAALAWTGPAPGGWTGSARFEAAQAKFAMPAYVQIEEQPLASAWSLSLARPLGRGVDFGLTLAQPLRAETGRVDVVVPVGVTETNASVYEERSASLTPSGREIDLETALRVGLGPGAEGRLALRVADEPGHVAAAPVETGLWLGMRWTR
jgi:subtilisin family serine protease